VYPLEARSESQAPVFNEKQKSKGAGVIVIDSGVRILNTCFDPSVSTTEWGVGDKGRLGRLCHAYYDLQGRWSQKQVKHCKRYQMKKAGFRIQLKIRNLVGELHKKMLKWLCSNYRLILLPSFGTKRMVRTLSKSYVDLGTLQIQTKTTLRESGVSMVQGDHMQRSIYFHYMWSLWQTEQRTWKERNL
jgi:hypothetical protein